eukprot:CAMPEP_0178455510 /NCGR_PEP_ID=MMETSP0689_2-20121128/45951_1 /TAXON_ID=160604 /ORGANISM="Amphidinium massartii, Strain CS-259" /LENGTH=85 /DNA_ID=CAMNT_0020081557 /DNA_START=600 /DNA_END=854 /DNA_ORIENTATION=-
MMLPPSLGRAHDTSKPSTGEGKLHTSASTSPSEPITNMVRSAQATSATNSSWKPLSAQATAVTLAFNVLNGSVELEDVQHAPASF